MSDHAAFLTHLARRFGVTLADVTDVDTHTPPTFRLVSPGGAYGYRWRSPRWACNTCSRTGMGTDTEPFGWAESCRRGHSPCPWCGRQLTLRKDGTPRVHSRCPERADHAELLREVGREAREVVRRGVRGPMGVEATNLLNRLTDQEIP